MLKYSSSNPTKDTVFFPLHTCTFFPHAHARAHLCACVCVCVCVCVCMSVVPYSSAHSLLHTVQLPISDNYFLLNVAVACYTLSSYTLSSYTLSRKFKTII